MITFYLTVESIKRHEPVGFEVRANDYIGRGPPADPWSASLYFIVDDAARVPQVGQAIEVTVKKVEGTKSTDDLPEVPPPNPLPEFVVSAPPYDGTVTNAPVDTEYTTLDSN